jgi:hypothetical protein
VSLLEFDEDPAFSFTVWPADGSEASARMYRALTPSVAAEQCAGSLQDPNTSEVVYRVRNEHTGRLFEVRVGVVPRPSFVAFQANEILPPPRTHVLWGGNVLCKDKQLRGVPRDWPADQRWISLQDVADGAEDPPDRCEMCFTKAPDLVAGIRQIGAK